MYQIDFLLNFRLPLKTIILKGLPSLSKVRFSSIILRTIGFVGQQGVGLIKIHQTPVGYETIALNKQNPEKKTGIKVIKKQWKRSEKNAVKAHRKIIFDGAAMEASSRVEYQIRLQFLIP
ncbi:hypothetical protein L6452_15975 [Arctium lappa]|uniref:Uncharacterized protein n=1 Tax=Arctium lappa TaxID=4217 RepID=A0ACB9CQ48_ARCLA|nr:hypothetical protein L6452_15975 [Arctium lappa]